MSENRQLVPSPTVTIKQILSTDITAGRLTPTTTELITGEYNKRRRRWRKTI